jgi:hypothetical protein
MSVVAILWDESENRLASPTPNTVRFNQRLPLFLLSTGRLEEGALI